MEIPFRNDPSPYGPILVKIYQKWNLNSFSLSKRVVLFGSSGWEIVGIDDKSMLKMEEILQLREHRQLAQSNRDKNNAELN